MLSRPLLRWTILVGLALVIGLGACFGVLWLDDAGTRRPVLPRTSGTFRPATNPVASSFIPVVQRKMVRRFQGHRDGITQVVFSSDGKRLASSSMDGTVRVWDVTSGKELRRLVHGNPVESVAFSPDNRRLLSGDRNHTAYFWDWESGELLTLLEGHMGIVRSVAFLPDGKRALVGSCFSVKLWDLEQEKVLAVFPTDDLTATRLAVSRDGRRFLCAGEGSPQAVWLWDIETQRELRRFVADPEPDYVVGLKFSDDESHVWCMNNKGRLYVWETETGNGAPDSKGYSPAVSCVWPPGQSFYLLGGPMGAAVAVDSGKHMSCSVLVGTAVYPTGLASSPDGTCAIVGDAGRWDTNSVWHIPLKRDLQLWKVHRDADVPWYDIIMPTSSPTTTPIFFAR